MFRTLLVAAAFCADPAAGNDSLKALKSAFQQAPPESRREAGFAYGTQLLRRWATLPADAPDAAALQEELRSLYDQLKGNPLTESESKAKAQWSAAAIPLLIEGTTEEKASIIGDLVEPSRAHRMTDAIAGKGEAAEPFGWDVQAAYALALARAGEFDAARKESDLVLKKIVIAKKQERQFDSEFAGRVRSLESIRREVVLQRALIEALAGDDAAVAARSAEAGPAEKTDAASSEAEQELIAAIAKALATNGSAEDE